jgi:hypothetical protein
MGGSIPLHPKYGLNPMICKCYLCGNDKNEIALLGNNYKSEAPLSGVIDKEPCDQCKAWMQRGIIIIGVDVDKSRVGEEPYRSGHYIVLKEEAAHKLFNPEILPDVLKARVVFMPANMIQELGLDKIETTDG